MTEKVSVAPSWHETTLQWIKENCPVYLGARGTPAQKLKAALRKASYLLEDAGHDPKKQAVLLDAAIDGWEMSPHNAFRKWVEAGGYQAPSHIPTGTNPATGLPTLVMDGPLGPETIDIELEDNQVLAKLQPAAEPTQRLDEAVASEELHNDDRYGAW